MPNEANITEPITVWSSGRAGSSLVSNLFVRQGSVQMIGETFPFVASVPLVLENAFPGVQERVEHGELLDSRKRAVQAARQIFLSEFPSSQPRWMHKPVGLSNVIIEKIALEGVSVVGEWMKEIFDAMFPDAIHILLVRNPLDVTLSGMRYWGYDALQMSTALCYMAELHRQFAARSFKLKCESLAGERKNKVVAELMEYCNLSISDDVFKAFEYKHAEYVGSFGREALETRSSAKEFRPKLSAAPLMERQVLDNLKRTYETYADLEFRYDFRADMRKIEEDWLSA